MPSRDLKCLHPEFLKLVLKWMSECLRENITVIIYETCRTKEEQEAYWLQGRAPLNVVNEARKRAGLKPITEKENKIITWTKDSPHMYGLAIDFVPSIGGKALWNRRDLFTKAGEIAERLGLEWGGRWVGKEDMPHIQMKNWRAYIQK